MSTNSGRAFAGLIKALLLPIELSRLPFPLRFAWLSCKVYHLGEKNRLDQEIMVCFVKALLQNGGFLNDFDDF